MSVKRRVIFTLLVSSDFFMLSRNFRLQKAGDIDWLNRNYNFSRTAQAIDELVVLNVSRSSNDQKAFSELLKQVVTSVFVPVAAGGGIREIHDAEILMRSGADKLVLNSSLKKDPELVRELTARYGSQAVVASVDFSMKNGKPQIFIERGSEGLEDSLSDYLLWIQSLGVGEVYLDSIDRDGTGQGYQMEILDFIPEKFNIPLIMVGGAGYAKHFSHAFESGVVDAVATANIFNFVGSGLQRARATLVTEGVDLATILPVDSI